MNGPFSYCNFANAHFVSRPFHHGLLFNEVMLFLRFQDGLGLEAVVAGVVAIAFLVYFLNSMADRDLELDALQDHVTDRIGEDTERMRDIINTVEKLKTLSEMSG